MRAVIVDAITTLIDHNLKINAIKTLRHASNGTLGLKEAKDIVELTWCRADAIHKALIYAGWPDDFNMPIKPPKTGADRHADMLDYARMEGSMSFSEMNAFTAGHKAGAR